MMKKYFSLVIVLALAISLQAQKIDYGLNLGANSTMMQGNGLSNAFTAGFTGGAFSRIKLGKNWSLQPEVNYNYTNTSKSASFFSYYVNSGYENAQNKIHLSYISVPVLLGYKLSDNFTVNLGPQYSFLVYENDNLIKNNGSAFKRNDLGIAAGAQMRLDNLSFYLRYVHGVSNINDIDDRYKWHNRQVQLGINLKLF